MITIHIGESERKWPDAKRIDESWINQQITRRQEEGQSVCVRLLIKDDYVDVVLSTAACAGTVGGSRQATTKEQQIF